MSEILILASITFLAAVSPWPDMIVVMKNAIKSSKLWYMTAIWVGLAILVHVGYCIAWVWLLISQSILLFSIVKTLWAMYLLYIAYQLFRAKKETQIEIHNEEASISLWKAFREGFITNVMNPKATLFFLSVFTQVIEPTTNIFTQILYGVMMASIVWTWFMILTTIMNFWIIKKHIAWAQYYLNKVMGWLLTFLGIKILISSSR